jgi:hypothetical protein
LQDMSARHNDDRYHHEAMKLGDLVTDLYGAFVAWGSLYGDTDDGEEQRMRQERVTDLLKELFTRYLPQSIWIEKTDRKKIECFIGKAEDLYGRFSKEIKEMGYPQVRSNIAYRVSKDLGPLRKEAEACLGAEMSGTHKDRRSGRLRAIREEAQEKE